MTNYIVASIIFTLTTNYVTYERVLPMCGKIGCAVQHYTMLRQDGYRCTNTVVRIVYDGETNFFTLKTFKSNEVCDKRSIAEDTLNWYKGNLLQ